MMNHSSTYSRLLGAGRPEPRSRRSPTDDHAFFVASQQIAELRDHAERSRVARQRRHGPERRFGGLGLWIAARLRIASGFVRPHSSARAERAR